MAVIYGRDADGREIVSVPLTNHAHPAVLYQADYRRIRDRFGRAKWFANTSGAGNLYVRLRCPERGNNEMVARLVAEAGDDVRCVRQHDRNPLNLRSSNLKLVRGIGPVLRKLDTRLTQRAARRAATDPLRATA